MRLARALAIIWAIWCVGLTPALACVPIRSSAPERYARGNLWSQIAEHADVIQIVRAGASSGVDSADRERRGLWTGPDVLSFELEAVETLVATPFANTGDFTVTALSTEIRDQWDEERVAMRQSSPAEAVNNPSALFSVGFGGYENIDTMTNCQQPFRIEEGDLFIAFRDRRGSLYASGDPQAKQLALDVEEMTDSGGWAPSQWRRVPPGLIRISSMNDPLVATLQGSIAEAKSARRSIDQRAIWDAAFFLVIGNRSVSEQ